MANCTNTNLLGEELERFLNDICTFLNDKSIKKFLPLNRKVDAGLLAKRSEQHLEDLRKIKETHYPEPLDETYDGNMGCSRTVHQNPDQESIYTSVSDLEDCSNSGYNKDNNFADMYKNYEIVSGKSGHLLMRNKMLFFEKSVKVFVAIFRHWFIVYANESASKPIHIINLIKFECFSCENLPNNVKKKESSFDVIPTDGSKSFRFTASSPKDMAQWITAINRSNQSISPVSTLTGDRRSNLEVCRHSKNCAKGKLTENNIQATKPSRQHGRHLREAPSTKSELKENNVHVIKLSTNRGNLHEAPAMKSFHTTDAAMYITVTGRDGPDCLPTDENDKIYDTLERIKKRSLNRYRLEEKRKMESQNLTYDLVDNCKMVTIDIETYWKNREK